ncbi:MAG: hypothetical protein ABI758_04490 [Candidatus Woesebacteria bacterium]
MANPEVSDALENFRAEKAKVLTPEETRLRKAVTHDAFLAYKSQTDSQSYLAHWVLSTIKKLFAHAG